MPEARHDVPLRTWMQGRVRIRLLASKRDHCLDIALDDDAGGRSARYVWDVARPALCLNDSNYDAVPGGAGRHDGPLVVVDGQGVGDFIQGWRFLARVAQDHGRVTVRCRPSLVRLARRQGLPVAIEALRAGDDRHVAMMRLDRLYEDRGGGRPYMRGASTGGASMGGASRRAARSPGGRLRVGLSWSANPAGISADRKSMPVPLLARAVAAHREIEWVSVQYGPAERELRAHRAFDGVERRGATFDDVADLAAAIADLDLLIGIDSAPAHLAGALGVPTWLVLSQPIGWRWPLTAEATPLYRSMRLFRQSLPGDWEGPISRVSERLQAMQDRGAMSGTPSGRSGRNGGSGARAALARSRDPHPEGSRRIPDDEACLNLLAERGARLAPGDSEGLAAVFDALVDRFGGMPWGSPATRVDLERRHEDGPGSRSDEAMAARQVDCPGSQGGAEP